MNLKAMKLGETKIIAATGFDTYKKDHPESEMTKQEWEKAQKEKQENRDK